MRTTTYQHGLAHQYSASGFSVHPVSPSKCPSSKRGFLDATTDPSTIDKWWGNRPQDLVGMPTGQRSGFWVLDLDGALGRQWLFDGFMRRFEIESLAELTDCVVQTPSGGLHLYFRVGEGEFPRNRGGDIATGVDTRGNGGYIIAAANRLPDCRMYRRLDSETPIVALADMRLAPRRLVYLATFSRRERTEISRDTDLRRAIANAQPGEWQRIIDAHRAAKTARVRARTGPVAEDAMRRQAVSDLYDAATEYASLQDGRRNGLFSVSCRLVRYVVHGVLTESELRVAMCDAAYANGALTQHGREWFDGTLRRALAFGKRDVLPPLARRFREAA